MKKLAVLMALLAAFAITFVSTGCKNGEDGDNGTSAEALILRETGNKWYEYTKKEDTTATPKNETESLATIYLKYDTTTRKLIMAAVGEKSYAETSKDVDSGKWAASAVALRVGGRIKTCSGNPTSNKTKLTDFNSWEDFTIEHLISKLFEE